MSFTTVLTLVFIVLKLTKVIDWSWWLVLSPMGVSACISLFFLITSVLIFGRRV